MNLRQLTYFMQIYKDKSFSKAAKNLYMTQQALSMSIMRLENKLNCKLFERLNNGIKPTPEGEYLRHKAGIILDVLQECEHYFQSINAGDETIKIACVYDLIGQCPNLMELIIKDKNREFNLHIIESSSIECEELVKNEECDLGIVTGPVSDEHFDGTFLFGKPICCIVNKNHPLSKFDIINTEQLKNEKIVIMNEKFKVYHNLYKKCKLAGFKPNIVFKVDRMTLIENMVLANPSVVGVGADLFSENPLHDSLKTIYFNDTTFSWAIYLISKRGRILPIQATEFKKRVQNFDIV